MFKHASMGLPLYARQIALSYHGEQKYGEKPYFYHLDQVADLLRPYGGFCVSLGYLHDALEDTDLTFDTAHILVGRKMAEGMWLLTDPPVTPRTLRKKLLHARLAALGVEYDDVLLVKVADRLANVRESLVNKELLSMYREEHSAFTLAVFRETQPSQWWNELDAALSNK